VAQAGWWDLSRGINVAGEDRAGVKEQQGSAQAVRSHTIGCTHSLYGRF